MLMIWVPVGLSALAMLIVLGALVWACVVISYERRADKAWQEQQQRMSEERASELANDCVWLALLDEVKNLKPIYPDADEN